MNTVDEQKKCPTSEMVTYSFGGCVESLVLNTFFGFSMLYYTKALGLSPELAAIATAIAALWDDPDGQWMQQIARNVTNSEDGFLKDVRYLIHDRDFLVYTIDNTGCHCD